MKKLSNEIKTEYKILFYFLGLTLLAHGLALLNNGAYWDDAMFYGYYQENNLKMLRHVYFSMGLPVYYYLNRFLWFFGFSLACNLLGVFTVFFSALCWYKSSMLYQSLKKPTGIMIGVFSILYMGSQLTFLRSVINYYVMYLFFSIAFYLGLKYEIEPNKSYKFLYHACSLILFFISFSFNALLMFYLIYVICSYILYSKESGILLLQRKNAFSYFKSHIDYFSLPFIFWIISQKFFPAYGEFYDYNKFQHFQLLSDGEKLGFIYHFLKSTWHNTIEILWKPAALFLLIACCYSAIKNEFFVNIKQFTNLNKYTQKKPLFYLFLLGVLAFFCGILPFILVGKYPEFNGLPESRYAMLVPASLSLCFAGVIGIFFYDKQGKISSLGYIFISIFAGYFILLWTENYLLLEAESAFQKSMISYFKQNPQLSNASIYWFKMKSFTNSDFSPEYTRPYEWSWLLNEAYSGHSRIGFSGNQKQENFQNLKMQYGSPNTKEMYSLEQLNMDGKQLHLTIQPSNLRGINKIGLLSLYYRFFHPEQLNLFFDNLYSISIAND